MKTIYWILIIFGALILIGLISMGSVVNKATTNKEYVIEITGTNGLAFQGAIMKVEFGSAESVSVDGVIPKTYKLEGIMSSVAIQKMDEVGTLTVTVKDSEGKIIKQQSTTASYGMVTIATQ